jgi:peroxiredoxin
MPKIQESAAIARGDNTFSASGLKFRSLFLIVLTWSVCSTQAVFAQDWEWAPDFTIGDTIPHLQAQDQNGILREFQDLVGENGLVLLLSRSFDWCPYCISQLQQLAEIAPRFSALGVGIATMTYDSLEILKGAELDYETSFPLLRDEDTKYFAALGVLNNNYEPGSRAYGIAEPGIFLLDTNGVIRFKFSEEDYRVRPDLDGVLAAAAQLLD